ATRLRAGFAGNGGNVHDASVWLAATAARRSPGILSTAGIAGLRSGHLIITSARENRLNMHAGSRLLRITDKQEPDDTKGAILNLGEPRWLTTTSDMIGVRSSGTAAR